MKTLSIITMSLMVFICMGEALAVGVANHLNVIKVRVDGNGHGMVGFDGALTGAPSTCGSSHPNWLAFNTNTEAGKAIMSLALAAHASGKKIYAQGKGESCDIYSIVESWDWGTIQQD